MNTLLLVDTSILLHKAIYVQAYDGDPVYTFWEYIKSLKKITNPDHIVFCLDDVKMTWRHKLYLPYKAQRPEKTEEFKTFKDYIEGRIKKKYLYEVATDYESDDFIGSLAMQYPGRVYIASSDLDLSQLVSDRITMLKFKKGKYEEDRFISNGYEVVTPSYIVNRFGVYPSQIPAYKALAGDSSDNIKLPIRGLGGVAASKMLLLYDDIPGIYKHLEDEDFIFPKFKEGLIEHKDQVDLFLELTNIKKNLCTSSLSKILKK